MPSPYSVFPTQFYDVSSEIEIDFDGEETVIPVGGPGEEVIVFRGLDHTQANLQGGHSALPGRKILKATFSRTKYDGSQTFRDIIAALWAMKTDGEPRWIYNVIENRVKSTWLGETSAGPTNDEAGNACTNETGRLLVIFPGNIRAAMRNARKTLALTLVFHEVFRTDVTWS